MPDPLLDTTRDQLGIDYLYPYQRLVVSNCLETDEESRGQIVVLPTGSGKTLCFLLPAMLLDGLTIVAYPLLALMGDQLRRMRSAGIETEIIRGGQSRELRNRIFAGVRAGRIRCLLANPEVLATKAVRDGLRGSAISHFVIDEAHCVSEWGESFRPAYLTLGETIRELDPTRTTAFTATASPPVLASVSRHLFGSAHPKLVVGNPDRANIAYYALQSPSKHFALDSLLKNGAELPAIVFCRSRKRAEGVARELMLTRGARSVGAYHAGLEADERRATEEWFLAADEAILAATCAYGMGVDKANVRTVIHFDLPPNVESFLQESGRAGRDGRPATSIVLWNEADHRPICETERGALVWEYVTREECRRAFLMRVLGAETENCGGCDCCADDHDRNMPTDRTRLALQATRKRVTRHIRENPRRYGETQIVDLLGNEIGELEARELIASLRRSGQLRRIKAGPWRGLLTSV